MWRLHLGRVFFDDYPMCSNPRNVSCLVAKGRLDLSTFLLQVFTLRLFLCHLLIFFTSTDMHMYFAEYCEVERRAQEAAIQSSAINPARAVDRTLISNVAATSLEDTVGPSATPWVPTHQSPLPLRQTDQSKGKEPTHAAVPTKRAHDGGEPEPVRKRALKGIRLADLSDLREAASFTAQVLALRASQGEGYFGSSSFP